MQRTRQQQLLTSNRPNFKGYSWQFILYSVLTRKKETLFFFPVFTLLVSSLSVTLLNLFLNNLPFLLHVCINVNIFVQNNIHHILNYEQQCMENYLFWDKSIILLSFVTNIAHPFGYLFLNLFGNFKIGVPYKRFAYKKRANSNLIADRNN